MEKISLSNINSNTNPSGLQISQFFNVEKQGRNVNMGYVVFKPGQRAPLEGTTSHTGDEYGYIISGGLTCMSGGVEYSVKAGDATLIPANEEHYAINNSTEDCTLIYLLVE